VVKNRGLRKRYGDLRGEDRLTRLPRGFEASQLHSEYLKLKSFIVWNETSLKSKDQCDLKANLIAGFKAAYPLVAWLRTATTRA
jgi:uncharacterized protein (DUF2461 family)